MLLGAGGASGNSLGIRVFLVDQFSQPASQIGSSIKGLSSEYSAFKQNLLADRNLSMGLSAAGMFAVRGMGRAVKEGAQFHYVMKGVETISEGTVSQMERLNRLAVQIGRETMFYPTEVASGMRFMAMAGQDAETIFQSIGASVDLAGATMTQLGGKMGSADIMTNALKAFGWEASASTDMADMLTKAVTSANLSLVDLGNSIRYVAATSRNMNIPVHHTVAGLMSLGNAGIQASMGGTALENMYRYLAMSMGDFATKQSQQAWKDLGMNPAELRDIEGNILPIADILERMREGMEGMDSIKVQNVMRQIFGVRGQRAGATMLRNLEELKGFQDMLSSESIAGTARSKMNLMMDTMEGATLKLASAWEGLRASFSKALEGALIPLFKVLTGIVGVMDVILNTGVGRILTGLMASVITLGTIFVTVRAGLATLAYALKTFTVTMGGMAASNAYMKATLLPMLFGGGAASSGKPGRKAPKITPNLPPRPAGFMGVYQNQRGQYMNRTQDGSGKVVSRFTKKPVGGTRVPQYGPLIMGGGAPAAARTGLMMGKGIRVLSGLFTLLGGKFMLMFAVIAWGIPSLISLFKRNTQAVSENTKALKLATASSDMREIYLLLKKHNVGEVIDAIQSGIAELLNADRKTRLTMQEILNTGDMAAILAKLHAHDRIRLHIQSGSE